MKLGETDKNSGSGKLFVVGGGFLNMGVLGWGLKKFGVLFGCAVLGCSGCRRAVCDAVGAGRR